MQKKRNRLNCILGKIFIVLSILCVSSLTSLILGVKTSLADTDSIKVIDNGQDRAVANKTVKYLDDQTKEVLKTETDTQSKSSTYEIQTQTLDGRDVVAVDGDLRGNYNNDETSVYLAKKGSPFNFSFVVDYQADSNKYALSDIQLSVPNNNLRLIEKIIITYPKKLSIHYDKGDELVDESEADNQKILSCETTTSESGGLIYGWAPKKIVDWLKKVSFDIPEDFDGKGNIQIQLVGDAKYPSYMGYDGKRHYYTVFKDMLKYEDAYNNAHALTYRGLHGYLGTIWNEEERLFVEKNIIYPFAESYATVSIFIGGTRATYGKNLDGGKSIGWPINYDSKKEEYVEQSTISSSWKDYSWNLNSDANTGFMWDYVIGGALQKIPEAERKDFFINKVLKRTPYFWYWINGPETGRVFLGFPSAKNHPYGKDLPYADREGFKYDIGGRQYHYFKDGNPDSGPSSEERKWGDTVTSYWYHNGRYIWDDTYPFYYESSLVEFSEYNGQKETISSDETTTTTVQLPVVVKEPTKSGQTDLDPLEKQELFSIYQKIPAYVRGSELNELTITDSLPTVLQIEPADITIMDENNQDLTGYFDISLTSKNELTVAAKKNILTQELFYGKTYRIKIVGQLNNTNLFWLRYVDDDDKINLPNTAIAKTKYKDNSESSYKSNTATTTMLQPPGSDKPYVSFKVERNKNNARLVNLTLDPRLDHYPNSIEILVPPNAEITNFDKLKLPNSWYSYKNSDQDGAKSYGFSISENNELSVVEQFLKELKFTINKPVGTKGEIQVVFHNELLTTWENHPDGKTHYYSFIGDEDITWLEAYNEAKKSRYRGLTGYLATITSKGEQDFIYNNIAKIKGWLGGTRTGYKLISVDHPRDKINDDAKISTNINSYYTSSEDSSVANKWYWASGPEAGTIFFENALYSKDKDYRNKNFSYFANPTTSNIVGANKVEPNDEQGMGESFLQFAEKGPFWNDLKNDSSGAKGFYIEYSEYGNEKEKLDKSDVFNQAPIPQPVTIHYQNMDRETIAKDDTLGDRNYVIGTEVIRQVPEFPGYVDPLELKTATPLEMPVVVTDTEQEWTVVYKKIDQPVKEGKTVEETEGKHEIYTITQNLPAVSPYGYFSQFVIEDQLSPLLKIDPADVVITNKNNYDTTHLFDIGIDQNHLLKITAKKETLINPSFYDQNYVVHLVGRLDRDNLEWQSFVDQDDYVSVPNQMLLNINKKTKLKSDKTTAKLKVDIRYNSLRITQAPKSISFGDKNTILKIDQEIPVEQIDGNYIAVNDTREHPSPWTLYLQGRDIQTEENEKLEGAYLRFSGSVEKFDRHGKNPMAPSETESTPVVEQLNVAMNNSSVPFMRAWNKDRLPKGEFGTNLKNLKLFIPRNVGESGAKYSSTLLWMLNAVPVTTSAELVVKNTEISVGDRWNPKDNFVRLIDEAGRSRGIQDVFIHGDVDTDKPGEYKILYSYREDVTAEAVVTVKEKGDLSSIKVKDSEIFNDGKDWKPEDNFISATDKDGKNIPFSEIEVLGKVDMSDYRVQDVVYRYNGMEATAHISVKPVFKADLQVKNSTIYTSDSWSPEDNFAYLTDPEGKNLAFANLTVQGTVNTNNPGSYTIQYSYQDLIKKAVIVVKPDLTEITLKNTQLYTSDDSWKITDNFINAKDRDGQPVTLGRVSVDGAVDIKKAGTYPIYYQLNHVKKEAKVIVKQDKSSVTVKNDTIYSIYPAWQVTDDFVQATNRDGERISWGDKNLWTEGKVSMKPGVYYVSYLFGDRAKNKVYAKKESAVTVKPEIDYQNWMSVIPDDYQLSQLSIPGTHDTMAYKQRDNIAPPSLWKTQTQNLQNQLNGGIRYVDLRVASDLSMHHGIIDLGTSFDKDVMPVLEKFLKAHPTEFILARIGKEEGETEAFRKNIDPIIQKYNSWFYHTKGTVNPLVKDLRGKIVVLDDTPDKKSFTSKNCALAKYNDKSRIKVQDNYDDPGFTTKYNDFISLLKKCNQTNDSLLYLNHLSAAGNWKAVIGGRNPEKYADYMKPKVKKYLQTNHLSRTGVLIYDYVGKEDALEVVNVTYRMIETHR